ncbi:hypothetical protein FJO98_12335 [Enterococcus sp. PF-2]|nr:hypothetical protein CXM95_04430 [Enterococcus sp. CR-Ec1]AVC42338.1 hypothetical protein AL523_18145 [Enterococcus gallinarum]EPH59298.1 hypothetical protein D931_03869 [Enterococcus faecium 13.SD.W.09]EPH92889.1 hypothetical protein D922_02324 [Enterococcus faecalis 06-MB-DW-09]MBO1097768.1 hypothetical protein [Enterococcus casseliflavus]TPE01448.1 hypothetical protein FJP08_12770 [Enterococcus sp. PF-3]TPE24903.1 hypothetical protein FJO98_12335 [Enterococcus sp. PF-2]
MIMIDNKILTINKMVTKLSITTIFPPLPRFPATKAYQKIVPKVKKHCDETKKADLTIDFNKTYV